LNLRLFCANFTVNSSTNPFISNRRSSVENFPTNVRKIQEQIEMLADFCERQRVVDFAQEFHFSKTFDDNGTRDDNDMEEILNNNLYGHEQTDEVKEPQRSQKKLIRDYKLKKKLGEGSFGCVYQAKHVLTKQKVAIKLIATRSSAHRLAVLKEASILRHLNHDQQDFHILQLVESFELSPVELPVPLSSFPGLPADNELLTRTIVCIVTEYIKGGDLIDYVQERTRLKEEDAAKLFRQLLTAIQWCHYKGIAHRDIKLENIMMASKTCLKLIDFGLSQFVKPNTVFNNFVGSVIYTAPEIFRGEEYNGFTADVWSCGVVLYAMVTGEFPWEGATSKDHAKHIAAGHWIEPTTISVECLDLLKSILTKHPQDRFSIHEILNHPWMQKYTTTKRQSAERSIASGKQELTPTSSQESPRTQRKLFGGLFKKKQSSTVIECSQNNT